MLAGLRQARGPRGLALTADLLNPVASRADNNRAAEQRDEIAALTRST
jgi:hypothetical protein